MPFGKELRDEITRFGKIDVFWQCGGFFLLVVAFLLFVALYSKTLEQIGR